MARAFDIFIIFLLILFSIGYHFFRRNTDAPQRTVRDTIPSDEPASTAPHPFFSVWGSVVKSCMEPVCAKSVLYEPDSVLPEPSSLSDMEDSVFSGADFAVVTVLLSVTALMGMGGVTIGLPANTQIPNTRQLIEA